MKQQAPSHRLMRDIHQAAFQAVHEGMERDDFLDWARICYGIQTATAKDAAKPLPTSGDSQ